MNRTLLKVFEDEKLAIEYLISNYVLETEKKCWYCKSKMNINFTRKTFRCIKTRCRKEISLFKNTILDNSKLDVNIILQIWYFYLIQLPMDGIINFTGCSSNTVTSYCTLLRNIISQSLDVEECKIGGEGIIVEVDETKLGKRKYNRGHRVEGVWCICGIERTEEKRSFVVPVQNRNSETIYQTLLTYVYPGSIVYTDCWKAYDNPCEVLNLQHFTVNHSKFFVDPDTGVHTNTVEGFNNALKICIKPRNRNPDGIVERLDYFLWRRKNNSNLWESFLIALKNFF